ncbi:MAG: protein kinase domain-containing protein [Gemmatimonadales bacterium]
MDTQAVLHTGLAGRYTLERELGRGGMAVVYLARDLKHDRPVALKVLLPELAASLGAERFQREIRLAARLQHPHILAVHDSGETSGRLWFTMPFVDGESLRDRLRREGRLPVNEALRITLDAAQALQYAHEQGIIHRDVKPENLLLTPDGNTLVADFGIARAADSDEHITRGGATIGTPAYMSPEQADGAMPVDARTDVYSLAAVLYEMLAGAPPYAGTTAMSVIAKWLSEPVPSARSGRPEVPEGVDRAIRRALSRSAGERFGTMAEFARALTEDGRTGVQAPGVGAMVVAPGTGTTVRPAAWAALAVVLLAAGFFAWRYHGGSPSSEPRLLAVLPFENLGDSADAYFADGIANELRSKLSELSGVQVIARGSSNQYRGSTKPPEAIARELGVSYLLTATVQWDKAQQAGAPSRVRVIPELVEVTPQHAARARWQHPFDAALTDVFAVQADIAVKVADELGVVLGDSARRQLAVAPTDNLAAHDEFLKGEAAAQEMKADNAGLRRAMVYYERAVELDPSFAEAWSQLSRARTSLYSNGVPDSALGQAARSAAERSRALAPHDPLTYLAAGDLHSSVNPIDNRRARTEYEQGVRLAPENVDLLSAAASASSVGGEWDSVAAQLQHALRLDPQSFTVTRRLATVRLFLRQYSAADSAIARAIDLAPTNAQAVLLQVMIAVARGDLTGARAAVAAGARRIAPMTLYPFLAMYQDLYWVLSDAQQREVLSLPPAAFDDDRGVWALVRTELYQLRGDSARALAYADSARVTFEAQSRAAPDDAQRHSILGVALGYLGRKTEAIREGRRGAELLPVSADAINAPYVQLQLARIYVLTGEPDQAVEVLDRLLASPFYVSPGWLRLDPAFRPLAGHPKFDALVGATDAVIGPQRAWRARYASTATAPGARRR